MSNYYFDGQNIVSHVTKADIRHQLLHHAEISHEKELEWTRWLHINEDGAELWFGIEPTTIRTLRVQLWRVDGTILVEETLVYLRHNPDDFKGKRPLLIVPPRGERWAFVGYEEEVSSIWRRLHVKMEVLPCPE